VLKKSCLVLLFCIIGQLHAQQQSMFWAKVKLKNGDPAVGITIKNSSGETLALTDNNGDFIIPVTNLIFGYQGNRKIFGYRLQKDWAAQLERVIYEGTGLDFLPQIDIQSREEYTPFLDEIRPRDLRMNPTTGGIEAIIKTLGANSSSELSSQYSVRGGNYDENLVYVNDIEIYRPQLISNGQQEGLSFINPDLVKTLKFSAGGFDAQYGDKMSSVLDVEYVQPTSFSVNATAGLLLNSFSVEGKTKKTSAVLGVRHFSNSLLTGSLDLQGAYRMNFADVQTLISRKLWRRWKIEFLGNLALNRYNLTPESRRTEFGTVSQAYQLDVGMAGAEQMNYDYAMGALTLKFNPEAGKEFKWILSATGTSEQELFDVEGAYQLSLLDRDMGSKTYGKPLKTLGFGYFLDHGRNRLQSRILNFSHIGTLTKPDKRNIFKYGIRINQERIEDRYKEWRYNDSAMYNIPPFGFASDSIILDDQVSARNMLESFRVQGFVQNKFRLDKQRNMWLNVGLRGQWWQVNEELFVTPRVQFSWEPNKKKNAYLPDSLKKKDLVVKLAAGGYFQQGFFRELRGFNGNLNRQLQAQQAWHLVAGTDRFINMWRRKFKFTTEAYYKQLDRLVPYLYDNIRVRYYAENSSTGYAWGIDNRINGEFIKGLESWFTLSVLQTREKISYTNNSGERIQSEWLRRPTDRRVNFAAMLQDQLPGNPTFRLNLNMIIGTGMPYFLDGAGRYASKPNIIPPYRRLDMGFSKVLLGRNDKNRPIASMLKNLQETWISVEIFNILGINNVISYNWVKDIENNVYGVPEYLTGRRLNIRLRVEF
jgi:hypothetical protein